MRGRWQERGTAPQRAAGLDDSRQSSRPAGVQSMRTMLMISPRAGWAQCRSISRPRAGSSTRACWRAACPALGGRGRVTRMWTATLHRDLGVLLHGIAVVFAVYHLGGRHGVTYRPPRSPLPVPLLAVGSAWSPMDGAGMKLLIPVVTVLFVVDVELAGGLSLLGSPPTMLVGFTRCSRTAAFSVLRETVGSLQ
jgi:hypothetical protein